MPPKIYRFLGFAVLVLISCQPEKKEMRMELQVMYTRADSVQNILSLSDSLVVPILYESIPELSDLTVPAAKDKFISAVLPSILVAKQRLTEYRDRVVHLDSMRVWTSDDSLFVEQMGDLFGSYSLSELPRRMKTHPNSIILAQAIVESGWGGSRFFQRANNLFGIWSYRSREPRIEAGLSRYGKTIFVRKYADISESVMDYFGTVGRTKAYKHFRQARSKTADVELLLPYLKYYSERREEYVNQLRTIIRQNDLTQYDNYQIDPAYFVLTEVD